MHENGETIDSQKIWNIFYNLFLEFNLENP
jgi:hypothetical protein